MALLVAVSSRTCDVVGGRNGALLGFPVGAPAPAEASAVAWCRSVGYQLDFVIPGSSPRCAKVRKQIRHRPNLRYTDRGRPHREHLV
jgi:hypothetical protein